jgi:multimeric flavodoxin WrbA
MRAKVLAINGSPRRSGNTSIMLNEALGLVVEGRGD